jgi:GntR family transcriptional regulator / MocR family aminotransferase
MPDPAISAANGIKIDRNSEEPIYKQLIRHIRQQIESGELPAGTRLPATRDLSKTIKVSRISVVNAYAELRAEGYLSAHAGRGTFVAREGNPAGHITQTSATNLGHNSDLQDTHDYSMRDMMRMARRPGVINFSHGAPPAEFYPTQQLREALNYVLDRDAAAALSYEVPEGYGPLRVAVREYVSALGIQCSPDHVLITGGAQQALDLVVQALVGEGDTMLTATPTYIGIIDIARARRVHLHSIPSDEDGIRVDCLENYLIEHNPRLIYVMPSFQNPTGRVMSMHRRRQLLNLANDYQVPIVEDSVYHEFRFEGEPYPPLKALDDTGIVIYVSAFTKMLLPGMRIGYLIATDGQLERLVRVKQAADISTSGLNQRAIHWLLKRGVLAQQLERNNHELKRRRDAAMLAAQKYLPADTHWETPLGGLYLWVRLPKSGPTAAELFIAAVQLGVSFAIGNVFYVSGGGAYRIRLNYGIQPPDKIEEGFRLLGQAWRTLASDYDAIEKSPLL